MFPTLPAEAAYTDIERDLIENEPPGAFPEDQNSYWGQMRKVFADYLQINALDLFSAWYNNLDPRSVDANDISEWEYRTGVPGDRTALTLIARRAFVQNRLVYGALKRSLVNRIIENFLSSVLGIGASTAFDPTGIPFGAGGIPMLSGVAGDPKTMYRVYYDYMNRIYYVRILNTLGEDLTGLTRELTRVTPGGWALNIADVANPLLYSRMVIDCAPVLRLPLDGNANDLSGYADNGTLVATPTTATSLIDVAANGGAGSAYTLNGTTQYITVPHAAQLNMGDKFTIEFWVKPTSFAGTPRLISKGGSAFEVLLTTGGVLQLQVPTGPILIAHSSVALSTGTTYHVVVKKNGSAVKIFINGVDRTVLDAPSTVVQSNSTLVTIGKLDSAATNFFSGVIDEVALYNEVLSDTAIVAHYNTGINVP